MWPSVGRWDVIHDESTSCAAKANEGTLSPEEQSEYEAYVAAGDIVATLQAVARKTLQAVAG